MTPLVKATAISVRAGGSTLLDRVDIAVEAGETLAIVGPNGAGKSTFLRVLSGELRSKVGRVQLKGQDIGAYSPRALAKNRAMLSQSIAVAFPFTVDEIVRMGANNAHSHLVDKLVEAALAEVDLLKFRDRVITTLSGGEQHRAHLARVFVQIACGEREQGPGLLLLDEPTASLDLRHQIDFVASTRRRARGGTAVVAVLHDLNLAATFADRIVVLHRGSIAVDGSAKSAITADMLSRVFAVRATPNVAPESAMPFLLPQTMHAYS